MPYGLANVDLVQVRATKTSGQDWDDADADGQQIWEGAVGCYLRENEDRRRSSAGGDVVIRRTLHVAPNDPRLPWETQQVVRWRDRRTGEEDEGTVQGIGRPSAPGGFGSVATVELILDPK